MQVDYFLSLYTFFFCLFKSRRTDRFPNFIVRMRNEILKLKHGSNINVLSRPQRELSFYFGHPGDQEKLRIFEINRTFTMGSK